MSRWMPCPSTTNTMHANRALSQNGTRLRGRGIEPVAVGVGMSGALLIT